MRRLVPLALLIVMTAQPSFAQSTDWDTAVIGPLPTPQLCSALLTARDQAERDGRIDFSVTVNAIGATTAAAIVQNGPAYAIGRLEFSGHRRVNDATLRRLVTINERDMLDVTRLRAGLRRLNSLRVFEPVTIADVTLTRRGEATVDILIPLRSRKPRGWSLAWRPLQSIGSWHASLSSRLPSWGQGVFDTGTYYAAISLTGLWTPVFSIGRPIIAGQKLYSGFAVPLLHPSIRGVAIDYGRAHLADFVEEHLDRPVPPLIVDNTLRCGADRSWLRRAAMMAIKLAVPLI